jgi:hypothetical protein
LLPGLKREIKLIKRSAQPPIRSLFWARKKAYIVKDETIRAFPYSESPQRNLLAVGMKL